jgi:cell division protein FtsB
MNRITRITALALLATFAAMPAVAQSGTDEVLRNLLAEVRALRLTLQKSSLLSLRGDLIVERIRTAQSRVAATQDQVDSTRQQLTSIEQEAQRFAAETENVEEKIRREYDQEALERLRSDPRASRPGAPSRRHRPVT